MYSHPRGESMEPHDHYSSSKTAYYWAIDLNKLF